MKTYINYILNKFAAAWKKDKFMFFFWPWLVSVVVGPTLLVSTVFSISQSYGYEPPSIFYIISNSWLAIAGLGLTIYALVFTFFMMLPMWDTYLYWIWGIIKLPYTISKWIFYALQDSYYSYKVWKGWGGVCCFTCTKAKECDREQPATKICEGYSPVSTKKLSDNL